MNEELPTWIAWWLALAVPIATLVFTLAQVWIAWQQTRIANTGLRHGLFEQRHRIYAAAKGLLSTILREGSLTNESFNAFRQGVADAEFFFSAGFVAYLKQLNDRAAEGMMYNAMLSENKLTDEKRREIADKNAENRMWFVEQYDELQKQARPFMTFAAWR